MRARTSVLAGIGTALAFAGHALPASAATVSTTVETEDPSARGAAVRSADYVTLAGGRSYCGSRCG
jgi:hypothetical protein